jgi:hypothetical protein
MLARAALKEYEKAAIGSIADFYKGLPILQRYIQTVFLFYILQSR